MLAGQAELLAEFERRIEQRKLYRYTPYPWQREFHDAGATNPERMIMSANQVGKTTTAAAEVAYHLTGKYPKRWRGKRFLKPQLWWCGSVTNESSKDIVQRQLLGDPAESFTGIVPGDLIIGKPSYRQAGVADVVDTFRVRHSSGGISSCTLKTYEQGWRKWQGVAANVWLDEEPNQFEASQAKIFSEARTRTINVPGGGLLMVTFTPLLGATDIVTHFTQPKSPGIYFKGATWEDAPHLDPATKARLIAGYPPHERDVRTKGVPMMGTGRVFPLDESQIAIDPFELPSWFARIVGIDFGIDHPAAGAWLAWDRDQDIVYIYDCYRQAGETALYHAHAIKSRGANLPVAWPHDGIQQDKGSGEELRNQYAQYGVNMLSKYAQYEDERRNSLEPALIDMYERMRTGRLKVFRHLEQWFEEFRLYHREDGKVVKVKDDLMSATRYGIMMLRYAAPLALLGKIPPRVGPAPLRNFR